MVCKAITCMCAFVYNYVHIYIYDYECVLHTCTYIYIYHSIYVYHIPLKARVLPSTLPKLLAASVHEVNSVEAPTTWMLLRIFRNNLFSGLAVGLCKIHGDQLVLRIYMYICVFYKCIYIYIVVGYEYTCIYI